MDDTQATNDSDHSILGSSSLVSGAAISLSETIHTSESVKQNTGTTKKRSRSHKYECATTDRLETIDSHMNKSGLSKMALKLVKRSKRRSTNTNYGHKWSEWVKYCKENKVQALKPRSHQFANFLAYLHEVKNQSYASILNYRSAIKDTLKCCGASNTNRLLTNYKIKGVVDGIKGSIPMKHIKSPLWDLFLVLKYLRGPNFEPIETCPIKQLSMKTLFLVMLACSRRISGIHALSGIPQDVQFSKDDFTYTLKFLPEFRAKNQKETIFSKPIVIKNLYRITDDEDRFNCPVRCLKRYLKVTQQNRRSKRRLFLPLRKGAEKDLTKNTLSIWIRNLISEAYLDAKLPIPKSASKTHEIRKISTSTGFALNLSLESLMEAAYWYSDNTFCNHYLRDVVISKEDNSFGINAMVVAGAALKI
jgi:hypothetical protein